MSGSSNGYPFIAKVPKKPTNGHDPLCPSDSDVPEVCGVCALIARVRADEDRRRGDYIAVVRAAVAEEIAAAIEEKADDLGWDATVAALSRDHIDAISAVRDMAKDEIHDCAAIARSFKGGTP